MFRGLVIFLVIIGVFAEARRFPAYNLFAEKRRKNDISRKEDGDLQLRFRRCDTRVPNGRCVTPLNCRKSFQKICSDAHCEGLDKVCCGEKSCYHG